MAKKNFEDPVMLLDDPQPYSGPIPGTVKIVNLKPWGLDITLTNGENVHLGPCLKGKTWNISEPVAKKFVAPVVGGMVKRGEVKLVEVK